MVSRAIEQHSELKQNLIRILNDIYPEIHSSRLDNFAEDLANLAKFARSSAKLSKRDECISGYMSFKMRIKFCFSSLCCSIALETIIFLYCNA